MKLFSAICLFFLYSSILPPSNTLHKDNFEEVTKVYICTGKFSKRYHYTQKCRGLSNCKADIKQVYLNEAKFKGRTLCGWED